MKLLHVIRTMDPAWGGPVEGVTNFTRQALAHGHHAEVVCLDDPKCPWVKSTPVKINAIGEARYGNFGYTRRLDWWLAANAPRFDALVANGIWMYFSAATRRAALRASVPYFVFTHGALDPWFAKHYPHKQFKKAAYWLLFEHQVMRDADAVLFTTEEEKRLSHGAFWPYVCNARVTGYGIADPLPSQEAQVSAEQARQHIEELAPGLRGRQFMLFLARVHEKKGIDLLLRAIARTRQRLPADYRFVIAGPGDGSYVAQLKSMAASLHIEDLMVWTGPLYATAKWAAMRTADTYVLPSHQENFGISVAEALANRVPVLITNKINIWREIDGARAGLVDEDDSDGITRLLERWFALTPEEIGSMRQNARQCFLNNFDVQKVSSSFFDLVAESVNRRKGLACAC